MTSALLAYCAALLLGSPTSDAQAAEPPDGHRSVTAAATTEPDASERPPHRSTVPWMRRWAPPSSLIEAGIYGGVLVPSRRIELFEADFALPDQGYRPLAAAFPELGLRASYTPLAFVGVEAEASVMPGSTEAGDRVLMWSARGHLVAQLARWSVTPFVLVGGGLLGVSSDRSAVGNDVDATLHFGGGAKVYLNRWMMLRLDVRDVVAARRGYQDGMVHSPEILLGVSMTFGRGQSEATPPPSSRADAGVGANVNDPRDASSTDAP